MQCPRCGCDMIRKIWVVMRYDGVEMLTSGAFTSKDAADMQIMCELTEATGYRTIDEMLAVADPNRYYLYDNGAVCQSKYDEELTWQIFEIEV